MRLRLNRRWHTFFWSAYRCIGQKNIVLFVLNEKAQTPSKTVIFFDRKWNILYMPLFLWPSPSFPILHFPFFIPHSSFFVLHSSFFVLHSSFFILPFSLIYIMCLLFFSWSVSIIWVFLQLLSTFSSKHLEGCCFLYTFALAFRKYFGWWIKKFVLWKDLHRQK